MASPLVCVGPFRSPAAVPTLPGRPAVQGDWVRVTGPQSLVTLASRLVSQSPLT